MDGPDWNISFGLALNGSGYNELDIPINTNDFLNTWVHVAMTYNGSVKSIYKNGVLIGTQTGFGSISPTQVIGVGFAADLNGEYLDGKIDEFRIWNRSLSQAEVLNYMNCNPPINEPGLYVRYDFNQGNARQTNAGLTAVMDKSSNGNNGTAENFALSGNSSNWALEGISQPECNSPTSILGLSSAGTVCSGFTIPLTVSAVGFGLSYQWKKDGITLVGATTPMYTHQCQFYQCRHIQCRSERKQWLRNF